MEIRRGDLVTIAVSGDYGKPRPALVIQHEAFHALGSVVVLRLTSELHELPLLRITVVPSAENGLRQNSQIMIDKPTAVPKARVGRRIGVVDTDTLHEVSAALARFLGLADFSNARTKALTERVMRDV